MEIWENKLVFFRNIILLVFFNFVFKGLSQDYIAPLSQNSALVHKKMLQKSGVNYNNNISQIQLPFFDDFSSDKTIPPFRSGNFPTLKTYYSNLYCNAQLNFEQKVVYFSFNQTYSYKTRRDSTANLPVYVEFRDSLDCDRLVSANQWYPPRYEYVWENDSVKRDSVMIFDTSLLVALVYDVKLGSEILWTDNFAYINDHYPYFPPSIGVATLDGLNEYGLPYNNSSFNQYGLADKLTSIRIDLSSYRYSDSIYLSFMLQPMGYGDYPDARDSLILQFKDSFGLWHTVWRSPGLIAEPLLSDLHFQTYTVSIPDEIFTGDPFYYHKNFQFRFMNYATISGNNDHWHIDYVYMDKNRKSTDSLIVDIAFQYNLPSLLKKYTHLPYRQFTMNDIQDTILSYNRDNELTPNLNTYKITYYDQTNNTLLYQSPTNIPYNTVIQEVLPLFPSSEIPSFNPKDSHIIIAKIFVPSSDLVPLNDTSTIEQLFFNEMAYDDGTAEMAYGVGGEGLKKIAVKYNLKTKDTLAAIKIHFSHINQDVSDIKFNLKIWKDIDLKNQKENLLKTLPNVYPQYIDLRNQFYVFGLDTPLEVNDSFYIGFEQNDTRNMEIGLDRNTSEGLKNTFVFVNNAWTLPSVETDASPMIRAILDGKRDFRAQYDNATKDFNTLTDIDISVFPNPFVSYIELDFPPNLFIYQAEYNIFNTLGGVVKSGILTHLDYKIDLQDLAPGTYFLNMVSADKVFRKTIIKK